MSVFYISPSGNDTTGDGSSSTPWATISKAHTSASSGDTIICKDGTYTWANQTFTKNLTIQAENIGLAIFDGAAGNVAWTIGAITITFTSLIFQNVSRTGASSYIFTSGASTATVQFTKCQFWTLTIDGGSFATGGIFGIGASTSSSAWTFTSCLFNDPHKNNTSVQQIFSVVDPSVDDVVSLALINCVVYLSTTGGTAMDYIVMAQYGGRVLLTLTNSIIYNGIGTARTITSTNAGGSFSITANYNDFYNITSAPSGTGNITSDPLFVDAAGGNFNLRPTSLCINSGTLV